ncbi:MAG: tetratricopeptide repeat protein [Anaerolineae bacterium]|nr:tetratricopeptide repeat protein [Anaerolineae bacterium]
MKPKQPDSLPQQSDAGQVSPTQYAAPPPPGNDTQPQFKIAYGDYLRFRDLVLERTGLNFHEKKRSDLEIGLLKSIAESPLGAANGKHDLSRYYNLLCDKDNPASQVEMQRLINTLTIGETHFFRDEAQFNALANNVLPNLIARKRAAAAAVGPDIQPQLRIWSVGCASGEEPYSVAILLKELLPDIDDWYVLILATDISKPALNRAQKAIYSDWSFREDRAKALRPRYFTRYLSTNPGPDQSLAARSGKDRYRLRDDIRQMVTFDTLNLVEDEYPAIHNNTVSMDLILCRNVTIYFTEEVTRWVIKNLHACLIDGGWLVVGHSEPSLTVYQAFQTHIVAGTVLYQKTGRSYSFPMSRPQPRPESVNLSRVVKPQTSPLNLVVTNPNGKTSPKTAPLSREVDLYEVAGVLLNKGLTEEAIDELHRKLASEPNFAPAHSMLGRAYANLGNWQKARYWCESAIRLDSLQAEAYHVLGLIYQHEGRIDEAINMLRKAIYLDREAPLLHFNLASLYKKAEQIQNARRACRNTIRVLEKWPSASIVPDSGGATAKHLLDAARRILGELQG